MTVFIRLAPNEEPQTALDYVLVDGRQVIAFIQTSGASAAFVTSGPYPSRDEAMAAATELAAKHGIEKLYIKESRGA